MGRTAAEAARCTSRISASGFWARTGSSARALLLQRALRGPQSRPEKTELPSPSSGTVASTRASCSKRSTLRPPGPRRARRNRRRGRPGARGGDRLRAREPGALARRRARVRLREWAAPAPRHRLMPPMRYQQALAKALRDEMARDQAVFVIGE